MLVVLFVTRRDNIPVMYLHCIFLNMDTIA